MYNIIDEILKTNKLSGLDKFTVLRGHEDAKVALTEIKESAPILSPDQMSLFRFKLLYLLQESKRSKYYAMRPMQKREFDDAANFYDFLVKSLEISKFEKEIFKCYSARLVTFKNILHRVSLLIIETLLEKLHYFEKAIPKEKNLRRQNELQEKRQAIESALGKKYPNDNKVSFRYLVHKLKSEIEDLKLNSILSCEPYTKSLKRAELHELLNNEPMVTLLKQINKEKILPSLELYIEGNSCFTITKMLFLDFIREISLHSTSTYGTFFHVNHCYEYTLSRSALEFSNACINPI